MKYKLKDIIESKENFGVLMQACSGSGKSTFCERIFPDAVKCSADDYFMRGGEYIFDATKLFVAHKVCKSKFEKALSNKESRVVIVDNTNTKPKDCQPYIELCKQYSYIPVILFIDVDPALAHSRNQHSVPFATIETQHARIVNSVWPVEFNRIKISKAEIDYLYSQLNK